MTKARGRRDGQAIHESQSRSSDLREFRSSRLPLSDLVGTG